MGGLLLAVVSLLVADINECAIGMNNICDCFSF